MLFRTFLVLSSVCALPAFGQLDSNSVTVTASRSSTLQPDQVLFSVSVNAPFSAGLSDVVDVLQGSGITAANFTGVSNPMLFDPVVINGSASPGGQINPTLQWTFNLAVPLASISNTVTMLTNLQQSLAQKNNGFSLSFQVQGTQVSQQLQQAQTCSVSELISDATTKAQSLANAAGLSLGTILAMSSGTSTSGQVCTLTVRFAFTRN